MKIICEQNNLLNGINIASKAVSPKTTLPILESIVIQAEAGQIKLISNNMEMGIETIVEGEVESSGSVAVSAKTFSELIRKFKVPDSKVCIETNDGFDVRIICEDADLVIKGMNADEFPLLPKVDRNKELVISQFSLREVIRQTVFSIAENDVNKIMSGELFEIKGDMLRVISLDGHRISIRSIKLNESYEDSSVLVPGKTLIEISKIISGGTEEMVHVYFTDKHILFEFDNTMVLSRLLEGEFFKVDQMITSDYETKVVVNSKRFMESIDRSTPLVNESEKKPIILNIKDNEMILKMASSKGNMKENVKIEKAGNDIKIGFNPKFLMDVLRVIEDEDVNLYLFNPKAPCYIRNEEAGYLYLILPINFIDDEEN